MFNNCSMMVMGDVYSWPQTDAYVKGKVTIVAPRTCGTSNCLPFSDDNLCDRIESKIVIFPYPWCSGIFFYYVICLWW